MGELRASKWLYVRALLDEEEMAALLEHLSPFDIYLVGVVLPEEEGVISHESFLTTYAPEKTAPPCCWSVEPVASVALPNGRHLFRPSRPVVQVQPHTLHYSKVDGQFRSQVRGEGAIPWGLQFGYPQIYEEPKTRQAVKVDDAFPNTVLFRNLQRWMRRHTLPTPFLVEGRRVNVPARLGKRCFASINDDPNLGGLSVCPLK